MNMEVGVEDDENTVTPAAKRPRTMGVVAKALQETPPPVVGPQTVAWRGISLLKLLASAFAKHNLYLLKVVRGCHGVRGTPGKVHGSSQAR